MKQVRAHRRESRVTRRRRRRTPWCRYTYVRMQRTTLSIIKQHLSWSKPVFSDDRVASAQLFLFKYEGWIIYIIPLLPWNYILFYPHTHIHRGREKEKKRKEKLDLYWRGPFRVNHEKASDSMMLALTSMCRCWVGFLGGKKMLYYGSSPSLEPTASGGVNRGVSRFAGLKTDDTVNKVKKDRRAWKETPPIISTFESWTEKWTFPGLFWSYWSFWSQECIKEEKMLSLH